MRKKLLLNLSTGPWTATVLRSSAPTPNKHLNLTGRCVGAGLEVRMQDSRSKLDDVWCFCDMQYRTLINQAVHQQQSRTEQILVWQLDCGPACHLICKNSFSGFSALMDGQMPNATFLKHIIASFFLRLGFHSV